MITTKLSGGIEVGLSHFASVGLAAIAEDAGHTARVYWSDEPTPASKLVSNLRLEELAEIVRDHARRHTDDDRWAVSTVSGGPRSDAGIFTVRAKAIQSEQWDSYHQQRRTARRMLVAPGLNERLVASLGEPAWWLIDTNGRSIDDGGSRWEMKTRNKGEEFFVHRFVPIGRVVASRSIDDLAAGLTGASCIDELGSGVSSRTATGLRTPGPTDSGVAWCAFWGLHVMPTVARRKSVSQSACVWPRDRVHPRTAVLPVFTEPVSPRRFSEICASQFLDRALRPVEESDDAAAVLRFEAARRWLSEQGVRALIRFEIKKAGSASAPERQLLNGEIEVLR